MNMQQYLQRVEALLKEGRMAPKDIEEALDRCTQFILGAGPGHEDERLTQLGAPEKLAGEILADYQSRVTAPGGPGLGPKILLGVFLSPIILAVYCTVAGLVLSGVVCVLSGGAVGAVGLGTLLTGGVGTLLTFVGGGCAMAGAGLLLLALGLLFCKGCNWCMGRLFGGRRAAV